MSRVNLLWTGTSPRQHRCVGKRSVLSRRWRREGRVHLSGRELRELWVVWAGNEAVNTCAIAEELRVLSVRVASSNPSSPRAHTEAGKRDAELFVGREHGVDAGSEADRMSLAKIRFRVGFGFRVSR